MPSLQSPFQQISLLAASLCHVVVMPKTRARGRWTRSCALLIAELAQIIDSDYYSWCCTIEGKLYVTPATLNTVYNHFSASKNINFALYGMSMYVASAVSYVRGGLFTHENRKRLKFFALYGIKL